MFAFVKVLDPHKPCNSRTTQLHEAVFTFKSNRSTDGKYNTPSTIWSKILIRFQQC